MEDSKMSLGYQKGNTWVADTLFEHYTKWEPYERLIDACRDAGFMFTCSFSYSSRRYCTSIHTCDKLPSGKYALVEHTNAYHENPLQSVVFALRRHDQMTPIMRVLCVEIEIKLLAEKLLPMSSRLGDAVEALTDTLVLARARA